MQALLQMDLTNLSNRQATETLNYQSKVQSLFTDGTAVVTLQFGAAKSGCSFTISGTMWRCGSGSGPMCWQQIEGNVYTKIWQQNRRL